MMPPIRKRRKFIWSAVKECSPTLRATSMVPKHSAVMMIYRILFLDIYLG